MVRPVALAALAGIALLGCHAPGENAAPPAAAPPTATNVLRGAGPVPAGDSARTTALQTPTIRAGSDSTFKVKVSFEGMAATITLATVDGRRVSEISPPRRDIPPPRPSSEDVCDCSGPDLWADSVPPGTATLSIQAKDSGSLWIQIMIYGKHAESAGIWTLDSLPLRPGDTRRFLVHLPSPLHPERLTVEPAP